MASITTPNEYEAQLLTDIAPSSLSGIRACLQSFHQIYGIPHVVITSISVPISMLAHLKIQLDPDPEGYVLLCAGSTKGTDSQPWMIPFPKRRGKYDGVGDLFASLLLGHFLSSGPNSNLVHAAEAALASTQGVLNNTFPETGDQPAHPECASSQALCARAAELKIVQSKLAIERPTLKWKAFSI